MRRAGLGGVAVAAALLGGATAAWSATPVTVAALPPEAARGRGAPVPFVEYEAENAETNGVRIGPDRTFGALASEASGRRAVRLERPDQYVEFTLAEPADAVTVRYAVPDSPDGRGLDATLSLSADGRRLASLPVTSRHGWFYGRYPFTNRPADGGAHHFYDEASLRLARLLPRGARVRLSIAAGAPWCVIDLADFERVPPPIPPPPRARSVLEFGADPTGARDSSEAIQRAIEAAQAFGTAAWLPPGVYRVTRHLTVDRVTLAGAGPWWSVLAGPGVGVYGGSPGRPARGATLRDFAIRGEVTDRDDHAQLAGIGGAFGGGSAIRNLWIRHTKTGVWLDGPADGLTISGLRVTDLTADGLNLKGGFSHVTVANSFFRNTGDDGLALWSKRLADHHIVLRRNTVIAPILANGIAVYGGHDISLEANLVADTVTEGGGLHLGNRFSAVPASGEIAFERDLVVRAGSIDPHWRTGVGAIWLYALEAPIRARVRVEGVELLDSTSEAFQVIGRPVSTLVVRDVRISGARGPVLQAQAAGEGDFSGVVAKNVTAPSVWDCGSAFVVRRTGGNVGWGGRACPATGVPRN